MSEQNLDNIQSIDWGFEPVSTEAWLLRLEKDLKGKPLSSLTWKTSEGFELAPFFRQEEDGEWDYLPGEGDHRRGDDFHQGTNSWQLVQEVEAQDYNIASQIIEEATLAEVQAFRLYNWGSRLNIDQVKALLDKLDINQKALHLDTMDDGEAALNNLYASLTARGITVQNLTGTYINDPLRSAFLEGVEANLNLLQECAAIVKGSESTPYFRTLALDSSFVREAGGSRVQEMAFLLARVIDYLDKLPTIDPSLSLDTLLQNLSIQVACGTEFFLDIANFRALRILLKRLIQAYDIEDRALQSPFIISQSLISNKSIFDAHNNLLRTSTEALSAVMGGAHAVVVPSFDKLIKSNSSFSARLARNIQHLLRHESYMDWVQDPAGGSYYIEHLTDKMVTNSWELLKQIEAEGGYSLALEKGLLKEFISSNAEDQQKAINKRKRTIVGVNQFANPDEVLAEAPRSSKWNFGFEEIRFKIDQTSSENGKNPKAYLLAWGDLKMKNARMQFSRNLLSAAGIKVVESPLGGSFEDARNHLLLQPADFVVFCSNNEAYFEELPSAIVEIRRHLPTAKLILAGKPDGAEDLGVDHIIFAGMDALAFLQKLLEDYS